MKTVGNILLIMISCILIYSCEKEKDQENVKTTSYFDYGDFITDGLVAYYPFNGAVNDSSGNGLNGIANNVSYSSDRFDQPERACLFNGINSYIEIGNSRLLNGNIYTICFWYRADLNDTLKQSIISKSDTARFGFTIGISNSDNFSDLGFTYRDIGIESWSLFGQNFRAWSAGSERKFEFAAIAFSETDFIDYFGGKEESHKPAIFFNSNDNKLFIGRSENNRYKNYSGELDDLLIYDRILTYEEIEKLYEWNVE